MDDEHRRPAFTDLAELSGSQLGRLGRGFGRVVEGFRRAAGSQVAAVATPVALRGTTLVVRTTSSMWAQQLGFLERELIERLREELPDVEVERIHARAGLPASAPPPAPTQPIDALDPARSAALERLVQRIADPVLRSRVLRAAQASEARRLNRPDSAS